MRAALLLVAIVVVAPFVAGAAGRPVNGHLASSVAPHIAGAATFTTASGVLDVTGVARAGTAFALSWTAAEGRHVVANWSSAAVAGQGWREAQPSTTNESLTWPAARIDRVTCFSECGVAVFAQDEGGRLSMWGDAAGPLSASSEPLQYCAVACSPHENAFAREIPAGSLQLSSASGPGAAGIVDRPAAAARGDVLLFLKDARIVYSDAAGPHEVETRIEDVQVVPLVLGGSVSNHTNGFVELRLHGAVLDAPRADAALLATSDAVVDLTGTARFVRAHGQIEYGGERHVVDGEDVRIVGAPRLSFHAARDGIATALVGVAGASADVSGTATDLAIGSWSTVAGPGAAPVAAGSVAAALALIVLGRLAAVPLYSRINRARVLANENRRRIHALVLARPGLTLAEIAREIGSARIVAKHHVQMLEAHSMLVGRRIGRKRRLFAPEAAPSPREAMERELLQNATRTRLVQALHGASRPLTQRELTVITGVGQRMVSHHLDRLERGGLVRSTNGMPRTYAAIEG